MKTQLVLKSVAIGIAQGIAYLIGSAVVGFAIAVGLKTFKII